MDTTKNAIEVTNLVKRYKELVALDHFNLTVKTGEIFGLLGPNGSGKTTTINCILSLLTYDKGDIKVFGQEMYSNSYDIKREIGVVMQNVAVYDELTVYENIDYFCGLYVSDKKLRKKYVKEAMDFVDIADYSKFLPKKLSGGLLRRLNIACGIAHKPKLIFFDEPTVAVDPQSRNKILEGIKKAIGLLALVITMRMGVLYMALSRIFTGVLAQIINAWPNSRLLNYSYPQQLRDMLPAIALSAVMGLLVYTLNFLGLGDFVTLVLQVLAGVGIYVLGSLLFKLDSFRYILSILKNLLRRNGAAKE